MCYAQLLILDLATQQCHGPLRNILRSTRGHRLSRTCHDTTYVFSGSLLIFLDLYITSFPSRTGWSRFVCLGRKILPMNALPLISNFFPDELFSVFRRFFLFQFGLFWGPCLGGLGLVGLVFLTICKSVPVSFCSDSRTIWSKPPPNRKEPQMQKSKLDKPGFCSVEFPAFLRQGGSLT